MTRVLLLSMLKIGPGARPRSLSKSDPGSHGRQNGKHFKLQITLAQDYSLARQLQFWTGSVLSLPVLHAACKKSSQLETMIVSICYSDCACTCLFHDVTSMLQVHVCVVLSWTWKSGRTMRGQRPQCVQNVACTVHMLIRCVLTTAWPSPWGRLTSDWTSMSTTVRATLSARARFAQTPHNSKGGNPLLR